ncbi:MAG TPA: 30S ribosomal protein S17 [bacterium]|uniref:Small ribosomal subunit protein uS17 n=1 Tax=uncultured bacterium Rifle_16ft_4_minimus_4564 TaxID=1665161 RepID=A0A0H4TBK4_9BACT|nr:30S ribosomal protein S17, small subunit ribosomal protein S17 [uncultured bacterium Rifle_16ft_4_minimus_4564]
MPKRNLKGKVLSNKMQKTVVVAVTSIKKHAFYGKYMRTKKRYKAHDEKNECKIGDNVVIEETRPLSKGKMWRVIEILGHEEEKSGGS